jgi:hypothetical protein
MATTLLSPGVQVKEIDLTSYVPSVPSSIGGGVAFLNWGPAFVPVLVGSQSAYTSIYGAPDQNTYAGFFPIWNFLNYAGNAYVVRVVGPTARNAVQTTSGSISPTVTITNGGSGYTAPPTVTISAPPVGGIQATATANITAGSVTSVTITNPGAGYTGTPTITFSAPSSGTTATATVTVTTGGAYIPNNTVFSSAFFGNNSVFGQFAARYIGSRGNNIGVSMADSSTFANWSFRGYFSSAPGTSQFAQSVNASNDELHVVVYDATGALTGTAGTILETYPFASKIYNSTTPDGTNNYYQQVINSQSNWVWCLGTPTTNPDWGKSAISGTIYSSMATVLNVVLTGGTDDYTGGDGGLEAGWNLLANKDVYSVNLLITGPASANLSSYVTNIASNRRDAVAFVSPYNTVTGAIIRDSDYSAAQEIVTWRATQPSGIVGSYAFADTGYKYQYDPFNNVYRWIALNGDTAGLAARTDNTNAPWWSFAGYNRGSISNIIALAYNPSQADRDVLYPIGVNPVVNFSDAGFILFGDKTLYGKPGSFDHINVRRLFITLEAAIAKMAKYSLFEFNDAITQANFRNTITPYLQTVKSQRGITDFNVVCDASNNTPDIVDSNQFVGTIMIKPAKSINYITLNFVAVGTGVSFSTIPVTF